MTCPECGRAMKRRPSMFKPHVFWWGCTGYPECKVIASEHPDGTLMSTPANEELKKLRMRAHDIAGKIWGAWDSRYCRKREMYEWMALNTKSGHIGKMDEAECKELIEKLEYLLKL